MMLNCIVDDMSFKQKPTVEEIGSMNNRLASGVYRSLTIEQFAKNTR